MNAFKARIMQGILVACMILGFIGIVLGVTKKDEVIQDKKVALATPAPLPSASIEPSKEIQIIASTNGYIIEATPVVIDSLELMDEISSTPATASEEVEGRVTIVSDPTYIFNQASSSEAAIAIAHAGENYAWVSAYSSDEWAAISYKGEIAFVSMDCVTVDGLADRSEDVFTAGVAGMSVASAAEEAEVFITPLPTATPTPTPTNTPTPSPTNTPAPTNTTAPKKNSSGATYVPSQGTGGTSLDSISDEVLLTCLVATESGSLYEERLAVASVVVNICNKTGKSMFQVISAPNQFSVYAGGQLQRAVNNYLSGANKYPECHRAAVEVLTKGPTVKWTNFWAWYYQQTRPNFQTDGEKIGATWFFDWH